MFGIGMPELLIIMVIALVVLGPQKLPELAHALGKGLAEFKKAGTDFQRSMEEEARAERARAAAAERERMAAAEKEAAAGEEAAKEGAHPEKAAETAGQACA